MNSNRKFDVLLDGTILSHTTHRDAFVLTPLLRIFRFRALKKNWKMPTSSCHFWRPGRQRSRCLRSLITCARQDTFDAFCHLRKHLIWILYKISCIQWWSTKVCIVLNRTLKKCCVLLEGFWGRSIERVPEIEYTNLFSRQFWNTGRFELSQNCILTRPQLYSAIHPINHNPTDKC